MPRAYRGPGATLRTTGASEIEVTINTPGIPARINVYGTETGDPLTNGNDEIRAGAGGKINLGFGQFTGLDDDVDVTTSATPIQMAFFGLSGNDLVSGFGDELDHDPAPATSQTILHGGSGNDSLIRGLRLEVQATDSHDRTQLEPPAGRLAVTR